MVELTQEVMYVSEIDRRFPFFLSADIGGTNSNFGVFSLNPEKPVLLYSLHYKSQQIEDFTAFMVEVIKRIADHYAIKVAGLCVGAAGIVYPQRVTAHPTNLPIEINVHQIEKATGIHDIVLINDFEAVALGVELLKPEDIVVINKNGVHRHGANIGFLGAGTGLGKSMLVWHKEANRYFPVCSEGGHSDAAFSGSFEYALQQYIQDNFVSCPVSWEMVLSGAGIQRIYKFLGTQKNYPETDSSREIAAHDFNPDRISYYAHRDERCKDTFDLYIKFYARCAKNFALDALTLNGLYIAGGIAAKNISMFFDPLFSDEFQKCGKQSKQLGTIPISLIADYNVSLYGSVVAFKLRKEAIL
jgi:glucokinase